MAINRKRAIARARKLRGWLLLDQQQRLLYRKEVIYEGDWGKLNSSGEGIEFATARDSLQHWKRSLAELRAAGIKSPFTKSHDNWEQTEDRLGEVVNAEVRENDKGLPSLFLDILFDDEKSRDIGLKGDVSIGSPPVWYDGRKRKWIYPLQHVASTNAPVIPGLETWQAIAAAFNKTTSRGSQMELDELIELLGIEVDESNNSDDAKKALVMAKLKDLVGGGKPPEEKGDGKPAPVAASNSGGEGGGAAAPTPSKVTVAFSHAHPVLVKTVRDARVSQLDSLVEQHIITPAMKKELVLAHCSDDGIKLELSQASDGSDGGAAFDQAIKLVKMMAKDRPLKASGRSAYNDVDDAVIELSHDANSHPLVKDAERRAAAVAAK